MCRILYILIVLYCHLPHFYVTLQSSSEKESIHELIFDEIGAIKRKVWVDMTAQIRDLDGKIAGLTSAGKTCECKSFGKNNVSDQDNLVTYQDYVRLLKGFNEEKFITKAMEHRLQDALLKISELEHELGIYKQETDSLKVEFDTFSNELRKTANGLSNIHSSVIDLQSADDELRKGIDSVNGTCFDFHNFNTGFLGPSFVSEWMFMRAHDQENVQRVVQHGLGVLPFKVEVQIRPTTGPNAGWVFHGDSAFQSDDDYGEVYGGIVYLYNETHVILVAPTKSNNQDAGVVVNTGSANFRRIGNNHQTATEAYVRVKVWAPSDFPKPDFKTDWLPLDVANSSLSYYELKHGLSGYPRFINVQIRCHAADYSVVSEGLGATMMHRKNSNAGGVVYAFSDKDVRLWTGYLESTSDNGHYRLIGYSDGWGSLPIKGVNILKGEFRILSWNRSAPTHYDFDTEVKTERNAYFSEWSAYENISFDRDLLSFYVEAIDGVNKGYRFRGYGNSQSIDSPFGGAVYAFNSGGDFRIWRPNATTGGYLIHVHSPYGNGKHVQASTNGQYVSTLIRKSNQVSKR
ncbi:uncharacterized protein LOC123524740 [Mercenaria mercenaria]|uniref:uncharacterized protein LOC123524740 n=1 Tax=Mercenaria mercenaria TaxID=6596 RepID=UPI00234FA8B6|nr:uncharacterized protein LOC123524740 [Mercenaria mercenaria]